MARAFQLSIVAPDRMVVETEAVSTVLPGLEGYFGVMAGHVPFIAALKPGLLEYLDTSNQRNFIAVSGGFAEVTGDKVTVLADAADLAEEIDVAQAEAALERARRALRGESSDMSAEEATQELDRAMNRLKAARRH